jgi:predicted DNA-binding transcriptional regulator AlpA
MCDKKDPYINERQAAAYLGVSEDTLYRYRTSKSDFYRDRGPKVKMRGPRQPCYKESWLDQWMDERDHEFREPAG